MGPSSEQQVPQTTNKDTTYQLLKKVVKFIISFSVFTFFFSNPSWLSLFLHSFISHVSSFPFQLLSHINDKNYIFLLFNGILVILAKSSSRMISENSDSLQPPELFTTTNEVPPAPETEEEREISVLGNAELIEKESEDEGNDDFGMKEEGENGVEENSSVEDEESCDEFYIEEAKDEAEEGSIASMSTEELNRKFEDFIRKMKEEIRIEAQQLLMV